MATPYWEHRAALRQAAYDRANNKVVETVSRAYDRTMRQLDKDIDTIMATYTRKTGLSVREAYDFLREGVPQSVMDELRSRAAVISDPRQRKRLEVMLRTDAYRARISRLDAIKASTRVGLTEAAEVELGVLEPHLRHTADLAYSRTMFDIQHATSIGFQGVGVPRRALDTILKSKWAGTHYSTSVWQNRDAMAGILDRALMEQASMGKLSDMTMQDVRGMVDLNKWRNQVKSKFKTEAQYAKYAANRLIRTESAYVANQTTAVAYEECGIERYEYMATLDSRTSHVCFIGTDNVSALSEVEKVFRRPYAGNLVTITTASKKQITGTPNHPVLTANGWLSLDEIEPRNQVLYSVPLKRLGIIGSKSIDMPTPIAQLFNSFRQIPGVEVSCGSSSATELDCNGNILNDKIDIVNVKGVLRNGIKSVLFKKFKENAFRFTKRGIFLSAFRRFCKAFNGGAVVCVTPEVEIKVLDDRIKPFFAPSKLPHYLRRGISEIKQLNSPMRVKAGLLISLVALNILHKPIVFEECCNCCGSCSILVGNFAGGYTVPVLEEDILMKGVEDRLCHVYNLQTSNSTYLNDSIIVHNCQNLDGKIFEVSKKEVGVNYPPAHPHCRSSVAPVIDGLVREGLTRSARDANGKSVYVPRDMKYQEWKAWQDAGAPGDIKAWRNQHK
jgi:SPP1 gp7 family putative phage head morphogenesis protein